MIVADMQSALEPAGSQSAHISQQWWFYFFVLTTIFVIVAIFLFIAIARRREPEREVAPSQLLPRDRARDAGLSRTVVGCVIATVIILFVLLFSDMLTGRAIYALSSDPNALIVKITGHQWWWEVQYDDREPGNIVTTANEVHIPTGRTVKFDLRSLDVIHSFWVPNLHGKKDLIPGHPTSTWMKADREGTYRGQCAEFCGYQHAHMRLDFVVESPDKFQAWILAQRQEAPAPTTAAQQHGHQLFVEKQCMTCHSVQGTTARATAGPDLTHFGSRTLLAAGTFPNTPQNLGAWIRNPQDYKPGVKMPANPFSPDDLNALVEYLESLK
jgi:cytochrome c oxidase subunit 2